MNSFIKISKLTRQHPFFTVPLAVLAAFLAVARPTSAATTLYWSGDGVSQGGSGTWNTTLARWGTVSTGPYSTVWNNANNDTAYFAGGVSTVTLGANITLGGLTQTVGSTGIGINAGAGPYTITLGVTGNNPFSTAASSTVGRFLSVYSAILGASGANLVLTGPSTSGAGIITLFGANTFSGLTSFSGNSSGAVTLVLANQLALQNSTLTNSAACKGLTFDRSVSANAFTFGGLAATSAGSGYDFALQNNAATPAAIALSVGNNNASTAYAGVMSGAGSLVKIGTGTLTLSGANTLSGTVTVNGGTLSLGIVNPLDNASGITLATGTTLNPTVLSVALAAPITTAGTVKINAPAINGNGDQTFKQFILNGAIGGTGNVTFNSTLNVNTIQTVTLGAASTYSGTTLLDTSGGTASQIIVKLGTNNALPTTTVVTIDGQAGAGGGRCAEINLNGFNQTLAGLQNTSRSLRVQRVVNSSVSAAATLTISNSADYSFSGNLGSSTAIYSVGATPMPGSTSGNNFGLTKSGSAAFTLSGANTYTGTTIISSGKLQGIVGGSIASSTVILDAVAATNGVSITDNTKSWTCANLTNTAAGVLEFSFGAVAPSTTVSPLVITGNADFTAATPKVRVLENSGLLPGVYPLMTWGSTSGAAPTTADLTVSTVAFGTAASLSNSVTSLYLVISSTATTIVKADNATNLNLGASWIGGVPPTSSQFAKWDGTVTSPNITDLGADITWAGITIADPSGPVTINGTNLLTLGAAALDIDQSAATADLTLNCPLALGGNNVWDVQIGRTLTVGGAVSGANTVTIQDAGTVVLAGTNSYSGDTIVSASSTLKLGAANVIPDGSGKGNVAVDGTLDLNTFSETINGLTGAGTVDTVAGGTPTLTVGVNSPYTNNLFNGVIQGSLSFAKTGTNLVVLSGINTFFGAVQLNEGYLAVGSVAAVTDVLPNVTGITISNGATLGAWTNTTLHAPITVASGGTVAMAAPLNPFAGSGTTAKNFYLAGGISGNGNVIFKGVNDGNSYGHILVANCTYTGSTLMTCSDEFIPSLFANNLTNNNEIIVRLAGDNGLPITTVLTMDGNIGVGGGRYCDLNLNGNNQTLAGLINVPRNLRSQRIINTDTSAAGVLTISNSADCAFSGQIGGSSGSLGTTGVGNNLGLVKSGNGTFTLARGAGNTYTNGTAVNGGLLLVNNTTGSGTGSEAVTVNANGTLGGTGIIAGMVTNNAGGTLAPGASGIGTLTLNSNLVLNIGATNVFEVNGTTSAHDQIVLGGTGTYDGVLKIVASGSFTNGQTFKLFSGIGATNTSNFGSVVVSPAMSGTSFTFTNGVLTAAVGFVGPSGPATLTNSYTGGVLSLSWPAGQGWRLQAQTNSLSAGLSANWVYVTDGSVSSTNITVDSTRPTVFYRLTYP